MPTEFPPRREPELVTFTTNFASRISTGYATYSLTLPQATTYGTLSSAFVTAYHLANDKPTRTQSTIELKNVAKRNLLTNLSLLAGIVQAAPTTTNAMRIDLGLPQRGLTPTPVPAPGMPYKFEVKLTSTGAIDITWKADNPRRGAGTIYQVFRQIVAGGAFTYLGGTGQRKFTDATIPHGAGLVTYQIQGVRSTSAGPWGILNVNYGTGAVVANADDASPVKLAA